MLFVVSSILKPNTPQKLTLYKYNMYLRIWSACTMTQGIHRSKPVLFHALCTKIPCAFSVAGPVATDDAVPGSHNPKGILLHLLIYSHALTAAI